MVRVFREYFTVTPARIARKRVAATLTAIEQADAALGDFPPDLERSLGAQPDQLRVPGRVELENGTLRYWWQGETCKRASRALLPDFLALADADDQAVLSFARKWGVLGLCRRHGFPVSHWYECAHDLDSPGYFGPWDEETKYSIRWAQRLRGVFDAIADLKAGRVLRDGVGEGWTGADQWEHDEDGYLDLTAAGPEMTRWEAMIARLHRTAKGRAWGRIATGWMLVGHAINGWMALGEVAPILSLTSKGQPRIMLGNPTTGEHLSLLGALALQMLLVTVGGEEWAICYGCRKRIDMTNRRRDPTRRTWCESCRRKGLPNKLALREWREKKRAERETLKAASSSPRSTAKTPATRNQAKGKRRGRPTRKA